MELGTAFQQKYLAVTTFRPYFPVGPHDPRPTYSGGRLDGNGTYPFRTNKMIECSESTVPFGLKKQHARQRAATGHHFNSTRQRNLDGQSEPFRQTGALPAAALAAILTFQGLYFPWIGVDEPWSDHVLPDDD